MSRRGKVGRGAFFASRAQVALQASLALAVATEVASRRFVYGGLKPALRSYGAKLPKIKDSKYSSLPFLSNAETRLASVRIRAKDSLINDSDVIKRLAC